MPIPSKNPLAILTCVLAITGWIIAFIGLCTSHAFAASLSWWIIIIDLFIICLSCAVLWANALKTYYPVILCLVSISIPYNTDEIVTYLFAGKVSLSIAASGYIIITAVQFGWIFIFGIQCDSTLLPPSSNLVHDRTCSSNTRQYHKDSFPFDNSAMDLKVSSNYPVSPQSSYAKTVAAEHASIPMYIHTDDLQVTREPNTIILSPHLEYMIPVSAIHNYNASKDDPNELSFSKGELLYVHEKRGSWWQAKKANGMIGMIPSNYVTDNVSL
ncbi:hypothetical protein BD560DRAFT_490281 [Blakeslea trispora]|nr:hypothetical protein BD560DRAFT_490281 [Blakeslea trispora]